MTDASNPIEAVRARLDGGRKWCKGQMFGFTDGTACMIGAATDTMQGISARTLDFYPHVEPVIQEQYPDRTEGLGVLVANFNDHPDTTWADVDLVLDKAARRWDEQVRP